MFFKHHWASVILVYALLALGLLTKTPFLLIMSVVGAVHLLILCLQFNKGADGEI